MSYENIQILMGINPEHWVLFLVLSIFRPLGMLYGFTLFYWGFGQSIMLRISVSFALGLLVFWNSSEHFLLVVETASLQRIIIISTIELGLGFGLGLMASAPFFILGYAGAITDSYRGENNSALSDPSGGNLSTYSVLYIIAGAVVFFHSGGLYVLVESLYSTYALWPVAAQAVGFSDGAWLLAAHLVQRSLLSGLAIAAPLLILFLSIDFALSVAAKLAPRFNLYENSFMVKNLAAVLPLPLLAIYIVRASNSNMGYAYEAVATMEAFIK